MSLTLLPQWSHHGESYTPLPRWSPSLPGSLGRTAAPTQNLTSSCPGNWSHLPSLHPVASQQESNLLQATLAISQHHSLTPLSMSHLLYFYVLLTSLISVYLQCYIFYSFFFLFDHFIQGATMRPWTHGPLASASQGVSVWITRINHHACLLVQRWGV